MDYALILTVLTLATGLIWALHKWVIQRGQPADVEPRGLARITDSIGSFFPILLAVLIFRSFLFEPFKIPSGSMIPTLLVGDFIVVNKFSYGLRLPVINRRFVEIGEPARGDVAVFRFPLDERVNYIKRVVGLPGDTVTYRNKSLFINGELVSRDAEGTWLGRGRNRSYQGQLYVEQLGDTAHNILIHPAVRPAEALSVTVPEGHYFVMGDNRDRSADSRAGWFVSEDLLVGRATRIWMHWDCSRGCVDFSRIGDKIQ